MLKRGMTMGVDPIGGNEIIMPVQESVRTAYRNASGDQQTRPEKRMGEDPVSISLQRSSSTMQKLGNVNEEKNLLAKNIREADQALSEASSVAGKMKEHLRTIVKNWPPFPQDSVERKEILMSYVSLRKEIEKLTFPPPPTPVYESNQKLWDKLDLSDSEKLANAVPELSTSATDSQVQRAVGSLDEFQTHLGEARKELYRTVTE
jgi:chaperonin cofactor prefoldin